MRLRPGSQLGQFEKTHGRIFIIEVTTQLQIITDKLDRVARERRIARPPQDIQDTPVFTGEIVAQAKPRTRSI